MFMIVRIEVTQDNHNWCNSPGGSLSSICKKASHLVENPVWDLHS